MYSELVDVPLFIYDQKQEQGEICDHLISNVDIPPTIAYLMGASPSGRWVGRSILPVTEYPMGRCFGEAVGKRGKGEVEFKTEVHFCREGHLKIIYREKEDIWELYDLSDDPGEQKNIITDSPAADTMKQKLRPRLKRILK
jgi:arylsulfatase A-like enzyme